MNKIPFSLVMGNQGSAVGERRHAHHVPRAFLQQNRWQ